MDLADVIRENIFIYTQTHTHILSSHHTPPAATAQISISLISSLRDHCIIGVMQHVILEDWLFSPANIILQRSEQVVTRLNHQFIPLPSGISYDTCLKFCCRRSCCLYVLMAPAGGVSRDMEVAQANDTNITSYTCFLRENT